MTQIAYQVSLAIPKGPQVSLLGEVEGDTYSKSDLDLPAKAGLTAGTKTLDLEAGLPSKIALFLISADQYSGDLTFKIKKATDDPDAKAIPLKAPFLVLGAAATHLLGDNSVAMIEFTNNSAKSVKLEILVGRTAVS